ncbi:MAG: hypothetical protein M3O22_07815 [Pseudomonadota bacterium]|nr:hypothetical protein [Pseudomonadota bacterium]
MVLNPSTLECFSGKDAFALIFSAGDENVFLGYTEKQYGGFVTDVGEAIQDRIIRLSASHRFKDVQRLVDWTLKTGNQEWIKYLKRGYGEAFQAGLKTGQEDVTSDLRFAVENYSAEDFLGKNFRFSQGRQYPQHPKAEALHYQKALPDWWAAYVSEIMDSAVRELTGSISAAFATELSPETSISLQDMQNFQHRYHALKGVISLGGCLPQAADRILANADDPDILKCILILAQGFRDDFSLQGHLPAAWLETARDRAATRAGEGCIRQQEFQNVRDAIDRHLQVEAFLEEVLAGPSVPAAGAAPTAAAPKA